jgi:hypothetical protein
MRQGLRMHYNQALPIRPELFANFHRVSPKNPLLERWMAGCRPAACSIFFGESK